MSYDAWLESDYAASDYEDSRADCLRCGHRVSGCRCEEPSLDEEAARLEEAEVEQLTALCGGVLSSDAHVRSLALTALLLRCGAPRDVVSAVASRLGGLP